jgi:enediyne biosynthesis protein E4
MNRAREFLIPVILIILSLSLVSGQEAIANQTIPVQIETTLMQQGACSGRFVAHDLDHITTVPGGDRVRMFEANGGGVGLHDLDNDGDMDIVLANHADMNTILWNEGNLSFRTEHLPPGDSRAVAIVDLDGDGWQDILFSRTKNAPTYWHNLGNGQFEREVLEGVGKPLYAINLADMDHDNDLDLVGATYDASLLVDYGTDFLVNGNGGVYYYENDAGYFRLNALATRAQALALALLDINQDGNLDIWVGNDFDLPDGIWYWRADGWQPVDPFGTISHSTMSLDFADVNNDGHIEVLSTDMRPYEADPEIQAAWADVLDSLDDGRQPDDPQINANVLNSLHSFANNAEAAGIAASGWSWSGKFGDLDQDGWLDLYIVNGFMEVVTFAHLPNHELVEANQVFKNMGSGKFTPMPAWGLGSLRSGRGMSMADMDNDGDLDIVVNNLRGAAELFENQLCGGSSLQVDLFWNADGNTRAIGSTLILHGAMMDYSRDVRAASGYISGDPARVHFGFADAEKLLALEIRWSDGMISRVDAPTANALLSISRDN